MINNKVKQKKIKDTNIHYKNKYLKYKNKYIRLSGGNSTILNYTIFTVLLSLLGVGSYILYNQLNNTNDKSVISRDLFVESEFIKDLTIIINGNMESQDFLEKYYKYSNLNLHEKIKNIKKDTKNNTFITMDSVMVNYILLNNLYSPFKIRNVNSISGDTREFSDTFILCLENIFKKASNKSYDTIKKDLIDEITNENIYDKYFEDTKQQKEDSIRRRDDLSSYRTSYQDVRNMDLKTNTKYDYIKYMNNSNNNAVSDIPMVHAAARKYDKYIILKVRLNNATYIKIFPPKNKKQIDRQNVLLFEYINMCDYKCDFVKDFEKTKKDEYKYNNKNKKYAKTTDLYSIDNFRHLNIDKLFNNTTDNDNTTNPNVTNKSIITADNNDKTKLDISKKQYYENEKEDFNNLLYSFNLINDEKKIINTKLNKRPYFQYYEFYKRPEETLPINTYINSLINK
jgi:hypothetical protein